MIKRTVLFGRGDQPWPHVPRDALGRPTRVQSATYTIVDASRSTSASDRTIVPPTVVSVDAASTLLTDAAGNDTAFPSQLQIGSAAGFAEGVPYLLTDADGSDREVVVCKTLGAAAMATANPVKGAYAAASTLQGVQLVATFPADWADDEARLLKQGRDFEIVWTYAIGDRQITAVEMIPVERWSMVPWIDEDYLLTGRSALRDRLRPDDIHGALVAATRKVVAELEASDMSAESYRPTEMGRLAVCEYALHVLYSNFSGDEDRTMSTAHREAYKAQIHQIVQGKSAGARIVDKVTGKARPAYGELRIFSLP